MLKLQLIAFQHELEKLNTLLWHESLLYVILPSNILYSSIHEEI